MCLVVFLASAFDVLDALFVRIGNTSQSTNCCCVLIGHGNQFVDRVGDIADLAVMRFDRLHKKLDPFFYRHYSFR